MLDRNGVSLVMLRVLVLGESYSMRNGQYSVYLLHHFVA